MSVCIPLLAITVTAAGRSAGGWWSGGWNCRRAIVIPDKQRKYMGKGSVASLTFNALGRHLPDARDIRVITSRGRQVPVRVLMIGPGDLVTIAFAASDPKASYWVYFSNANSTARRLALDIRRGILQETWRYTGRPAHNPKQAKIIFAKPGKLLGRGFCDRVFQGCNPFGPQSRIVSRFTGWFEVRLGGEYTFATASNNASFMLINDELIVSNGGWHRPLRRGPKSGKVRLKRGLHKMTVGHVNRGGNPIIATYWRTPNSKRYRVISPGAFTPVVRCSAGKLQERGKAITVDVSVKRIGESFVSGAYYQRYRFRGDWFATTAKGLKWQWTWDFGDGQTATGQEVDHVFLADGLNEITLTAQSGERRGTRKTRLAVSRNWRLVMSSRLDRISEQAAIVAKYNFAVLPGKHVAGGFEILRRGSQPEAMLRAAVDSLKRDSLPGKAVTAIVLPAVDAMKKNDDVDSAIDVLLAGAEVSSDPNIAGDMRLRAGLMLLNGAGLIDEAMQQFVRASSMKSKITRQVYRRSQIGIGDVWRFKGNRAKALASYEKAGFGTDVGKKTVAFLRGSYARHVEEYILSRRYEWAEQYLARWRNNIPADMLAGWHSMLAVRLHMARGQDESAAREAAVLVRVSPTSSYAPQLLATAAEAYEAMKRPAAAKTALQKIVDKYPESELYDTARSKLGRK